jgi:hypothetical protein
MNKPEINDPEKIVRLAFEGFLFTQRINPKDMNSDFMRTFYQFFKAGWLERQKRTDISIDNYHAKFKARTA